MGEKFAFAFDIAVIVILAVFAFVGLKRGFAKVVLGLVSTAVAFVCAMTFSGPIAEGIYGNFIEKPIEEQLDSTVNKVFSELKLGDVANIDFSKVRIGSTAASDVELNYAGTRKAVVDLSKLDLYDTGLTQADLEKLGIKGDINLHVLNAKTAEFTMDDVERYGLGKLATAQYIAVNFMQQPQFESFNSIAESIRKYLPRLSGSASSDSTGVSAVRAIVLKMFETNDSFKGAVMNGIIKPNCTLLIKTIAFGVIFFVVNLVLRIITAAAKLTNKIPVIGKVNAALGLVLGALEGLVAVFVVCLATRLVVSIGSANSILFNKTAIDSTFLFKIFYNFDFLNFLK